jgi:glycosyltransferase involved in cell wall biosynthesis
MSTVDCAIMPSIWWENAPLVIQEAQAQNCPVITSNIGGMAEMVEDGVNGLTVPPNDPPALAAAMRQMAEDADLRQILALGARHPDIIDTTVARYLALIERLRPVHVEAA